MNIEGREFTSTFCGSLFVNLLFSAQMIELRAKPALDMVL